MNRFLLLLTVFVILLCTSSCQLTHNDITNLPIDIVSPDFEYIEIDDKPYDYNYVVGANQLQYSDGYLYCYDSIISDKNKTLKKIDIKTGIVTSVCSDPICLHNSPECPIFGIANAFFVHNNNVFFKRLYTYRYRNTDGSIRNTAEVSDSVCFNIDKSKLTVLESYESQSILDYTEQLFVDNYRYYYDYIYNETEDKHLFKICRLNIDTGEISAIGEENRVDEILYRFLFSLNERIYFTDGKRLFSRSLDNTDEQLHCYGSFGDKVLTDGTGVYFDLSNNGLTDVYYMSNLNDYNSAKLIIKGCSSWELTENYIYFIDGEQRVIGNSAVSGYQGQDIVLRGKNIFRCSHSGDNIESVFTFENEFKNHKLTNIVVVDNYIYGLYNYWTDSDGDGVLQDDDVYYSSEKEHFNIMRIDATNGTVHYLTLNQ